MRLLAIDHVQLAIPPGGEARARAFWRDALGFDEVAKPEPLARRGGCWFESGAARVHVGVESDFAPARKAHPALVTDDLDELRRVLEAAGHACRCGEPVRGQRRFHTDDPFGNRVEFVQYVEA